MRRIRVMMVAQAEAIRRSFLWPNTYRPPTDWVREQVELYESSGGTEGTTLRDTGLPVIVVTNRGNRTGAIRKTPLMRVKDGDNYVLVALPGRRPQEPGGGSTTCGPTATSRFRTRPRPIRCKSARVQDGDERARLWEIAAAAFPQLRRIPGSHVAQDSGIPGRACVACAGYARTSGLAQSNSLNQDRSYAVGYKIPRPLRGRARVGVNSQLRKSYQDFRDFRIFRIAAPNPGNPVSLGKDFAQAFRPFPKLPGNAAIPKLPGDAAIPKRPGDAVIPKLPGNAVIPKPPGNAVIPKRPRRCRHSKATRQCRHSEATRQCRHSEATRRCRHSEAARRCCHSERSEESHLRRRDPSLRATGGGLWPDAPRRGRA